MSESFIRSNESVEKFIAALEARGLLSDRLTAKLRHKVARSERPLTAKALAKFLVDKEHLTQQQATDVLGSLVRSGVDVDPAAAEEVAADDADTVVPLVGPAAPVQVAGDSVPQLSADQAEDYEGSSIFEPFPVERPAPAEPEEEIGLAPTSEIGLPAAGRDEAPPIEPASIIELPDLPDPKAKAKSRKREKQAAAERAARDERLEEPVTAATGTLGEHVKRLKKKKPPKRTSEWESPLLLWGGGTLALLVIGGVTIAWLLNWESGDEKLRLAQEALSSGSYSQAITHYQEFLERHPRHRDRSLARVKLATARLRKATEAGNYQSALITAREELQEIESEEKFSDAHGELAALLPRIALGLAKEAEAAEPTEAKNLIEQSNAALGLANNTNYVPKSLRDEAELNQVRETLARIERRRQSEQDLEEAIAAMTDALAAGDTRAAYANHIKFIQQRPDLAGDARLAEMIQKTTAAEQAAIRFTEEAQPAATSERPTPWLAALAVANRRVQPTAAPGEAANSAAVFRIDGAVYGFDTSGRLLWRRYVGHARAAWPIAVGSNVLVADTRRHELLMLESATGRLVWRQEINEAFAAPLIVNGRGFVAVESGRLYVIDLKSGARSGYLQFAQPLRVAPTADRAQQRLYLTGDHSSLYTISLADLSCLGVHYIGHAAGSVTVPPVAVMNKLAVLENDGVATSRLRLMSLNEQGIVTGQATERRLAGLASAAPFVTGRRLIVTTDRGLVEVYEIATADGADALTLIAARAATGKGPLIRYAALAGNHIWIGDTQLHKYSILPTGNRLPVESLDENFAGSTFTHPLALQGELLLHARRRKDRAGATVAATNVRGGHTIWETDVAIPPAGAPVVDDSERTLLVADAEGNVFRFDEGAIRARVQDASLPNEAMPAELPPLTVAVDLGQGRAVFAAPGADRLLLCNPGQRERPVRWVPLAAPLAGAPTPLGKGVVVPSRIGQVFYLNAADGMELATPFQPPLQPGANYDYKPATVVDQEAGQFIITDGDERIYLVGVHEQPQPHLQAVAEAATGDRPIETPLIVMGEAAVAVAGSSHLVRFRLPSLEPAGEANLPAPAIWGPHLAGKLLILATANEQLIAMDTDGKVAWQMPIKHGDLAGTPLVIDESLLFTYRNGVVERRAMSNGQSLAVKDMEHPLAAAAVRFMNRLVLTAGDGTLLVADAP